MHFRNKNFLVWKECLYLNLPRRSVESQLLGTFWRTGFSELTAVHPLGRMSKGKFCVSHQESLHPCKPGLQAGWTVLRDGNALVSFLHRSKECLCRPVLLQTIFSEDTAPLFRVCFMYSRTLCLALVAGCVVAFPTSVKGRTGHPHGQI